MPEATLKALADHGEIGTTLPVDGGDCERGFGTVRQSRHRYRRIGSRLQDEGAKSFIQSWNDLMSVIMDKSATLKRAAAR